jgi:PAS domain S-box-containing protein
MQVGFSGSCPAVSSSLHFLYEITTLYAKLLHGVLVEKLNKSLQAENVERLRAERRARQAERELRVTIDTIPAIVTRYRGDGSPDFVNQTWRTYTGLSNDSLRGQRPGLAVHPDDLPKLHAAWSAHLATGQPFEMEQRLRRADGEYRWFRWPDYGRARACARARVMGS